MLNSLIGWLDDAFALLTLTHQFTCAANRFSLLAGAFFRRFFVEFPALHFPESTLALHFFLKRFKGLLDIVVADKDLNQGSSPPYQIKTSRVGGRDVVNCQPIGVCFMQTG